MIKIIEADSKKWMKAFISFPHQLYNNDPFYIPLPDLVMLDMFNEKKNPFFRNAIVAYFLAVDENGNVFGRIAAIENLDHLEQYKDETGFFGFFDCVNDEGISNILLDACRDWLGKRGLSRMIGPEDFTTNDKIGILTRGYDKSPAFLMPYNYPYYPELLKQNGLEVVMNLYSYEINYQNLPPEIFKKAAQIEERLLNSGFKIRPINLKYFDDEISKLRKVYNDSNVDNWGFLPLDEIQFRYMANDLKKLIKSENVWVVEKDSRFIGYSLAVPDFNQVFKKIKNGRLFPSGWWYLLRPEKKINRCRVMILGVLPEFRNKGIDWCLYAHIAQYAKSSGHEIGEACYVMQSNRSMLKMLHVLGGKQVHDYAVYGGDV